jgi:hypothetical protein
MMVHIEKNKLIDGVRDKPLDLQKGKPQSKATTDK